MDYWYQRKEATRILTEKQLENLAAGYKPTLVWARFSDVPSYDPEKL